jgi:transglutaminase-like putative cysteine protease
MSPPVLAGLLAAALLAAAPPAGATGAPASEERGPGERRFVFRYTAEIGPVPAGSGPVHVFIPIPSDTALQTVEALEIVSPLAGAIESEPVYGNRFWHGRLAESDGNALPVTLEAVVRRSPAGRSAPGPAGAQPLGPDERARFLGPNRRVVVGHEMLEPILAETRAAANGGGQEATARALYDWVVDNVTYKKVGSGWGNGDTFWACSERYGNCTDFHALLISLARTEGIPARFQMGFPVPEDRPRGRIGGYHCWVDLYLPGTGWLPVDASEASKHPEKRELLFGSQPADRLHLSTGRDLRLGSDHRSAPLNYFVYPHVEVAGEAWTGPLERRFEYRDLAPAEPARPEMAATGGAPAGRIPD